MGDALDCQKIECEQETIDNILSSMNINEIPCKTAYEEYMKCINSQTKLTVEENKYINFTNALIGHKTYSEAQKEFFKYLPDYKSKIIGPICILLAQGSKEEKSKLLCEHYNKYYSPEIKEYISDICKVQSQYCIDLFKNNLGKDAEDIFTEAYTNQRIMKLTDFILKNYFQVKTKYLNKNNGKTDSGDNDKLISSEFFDLSIGQLDGEYIRNWLYDEYLRDKEFNCTGD